MTSNGLESPSHHSVRSHSSGCSTSGRRKSHPRSGRLSFSPDRKRGTRKQSRSRSSGKRRSHDDSSSSLSKERGRRTLQLTERKSPMDSPKCKVVVTNLTRTVTDGHIKEVFGFFGTVKEVNLTKDRVKPSRFKAVVIFETAEDAAAAQKHLDRGQIDGDTIRVTEFALLKGSPRERSESPTRRGRRYSEGSWISESPPRKRRRELDYTTHRVPKRDSSFDRKRSFTPPRQKPRRYQPLPPYRRPIHREPLARPVSPLRSLRKSLSPSRRRRPMLYSRSPSRSRRADRKRDRSRSASSWSSRSHSVSRSQTPPRRRNSSRPPPPRSGSRSISLDSTGRRRRRSPIPRKL